MPIEKMPVQKAIDLIDGPLAKELGIRRLDEVSRTKAHFFEIGTHGRQFAVVVNDLDKDTGTFTAQQTRVLLEFSPNSIQDTEIGPADDYYNGGSVDRTKSRLKPPRQHSVYVGSEEALQSLLKWYAGANAITPAPDLQASGMTETKASNSMTTTAQNVILYGPPGTGKTYSTVVKAMSLIDGTAYRPEISADEYERLKQRFDALKAEGQIEFVTFHQSYGYEDFMQGLRPTVEDGQVRYEVRDGVLKRIAERALNNFELSGTGARSSVDDEATFQTALKNLQVAIEAGDEARSTMTIFSGPKAKVIIEPDGKRLFFNVPSTGKPWRIHIKKLRALWPRRHEIHVPSDIGGFNSSYWWAGLNLLKSHVDESKQPKVTPEPTKQYVLVIDEINRGNVSKIFGELITLVEADKRIGARYETRVTLPNADMEDDAEPFGLPVNLHIVGTMNTADRSIALLDTALRRRFQFEEIVPRPELLRNDVGGVNLQSLLKVLNERIETLYDRDHMIGHAYLIDVENLEQLEAAFRYRVIPLLQEYFYENWSKVRVVLNDVGAGDFIEKYKPRALPNDGDEGFEPDDRAVYGVNKAKFPIAAYKRIYGE